MMQIVEQNREERAAMYMRMPQAVVVDMLMENQDIVQRMTAPPYPRNPQGNTEDANYCGNDHYDYLVTTSLHYR